MAYTPEDNIVMKKKVALHTLGCRLNFSETGTLAQGFAKRGYSIVPFGEDADVTLINTCTVTDSADSSCRNLIRKAHRTSPEGKVVVVGCYAQMDSERIKDIQGVDLVLGTAEKYKVFDYLDEDDEQVVNIDMTNDFWGAATTPEDSHTRAFLKIQDGCNYICSFCIIPQARGRSRAIEPSQALHQAKELVANGFNEIILTGVNIGEYEKSAGYPFYRLVDDLLQVDGLERLRLSSVEPNTITDDLLAVLANSPKSMDHFHIPLQSGDDEILKSMRRKYTSAEYIRTIEKIKNIFPEAGIGADIMVGYPGESKEQFQNTYDLLHHFPITHFHPFPFSSRKGTTAAKMDNQLQHDIKKDRVRAITMLGEAKLSTFAQEQVEKNANVLFERRNKEGLWEGYTSNFVRIRVESEADLKNQIQPVHVLSSEGEFLKGSLLN